MEGGREGWREGGRDGGRKGGMEGGREGWREGGRDGGREGGMEGGRERIQYMICAMQGESGEGNFVGIYGKHNLMLRCEGEGR